MCSAFPSYRIGVIHALCYTTRSRDDVSADLRLWTALRVSSTCITKVPLLPHLSSLSLNFLHRVRCGIAQHRYRAKSLSASSAGRHWSLQHHGREILPQVYSENAPFPISTKGEYTHMFTSVQYQESFFATQSRYAPPPEATSSALPRPVCRPWLRNGSPQWRIHENRRRLLQRVSCSVTAFSIKSSSRSRAARASSHRRLSRPCRAHPCLAPLRGSTHSLRNSTKPLYMANVAYKRRSFRSDRLQSLCKYRAPTLAHFATQLNAACAATPGIGSRPTYAFHTAPLAVRVPNTRKSVVI